MAKWGFGAWAALAAGAALAIWAAIPGEAPSDGAAGKAEAPEWAISQAPELYRASVERANADAKSQFGPLWQPDSKVEVLSAAVDKCSPAGDGLWDCRLDAKLLLGGKAHADRRVELRLSRAEGSEAKIVSQRRIAF